MKIDLIKITSKKRITPILERNTITALINGKKAFVYIWSSIGLSDEHILDMARESLENLTTKC